MKKIRIKIRLKSTKSGYFKTTTVNRRNTPDKLEKKMFDPTPGVRAHVLFKEAKIK